MKLTLQLTLAVEATRIMYFKLERVALFQSLRLLNLPSILHCVFRQPGNEISYRKSSQFLGTLFDCLFFVESLRENESLCEV